MKILRPTTSLSIGVLLLSSAAPVAAAQCEGGWAGTVTYARTQNSNNSKTVDRISGKGTQTTDSTFSYDYAAQVAVRPNGSGDSLSKANISLASVATETVASRDQQICPHTKHYRTMTGNLVSKTEVRANGSGLEAEVNVTDDNDGTYTVSVRLPEVAGTTTGSTSSSFGGQCTPKEGTNNNLPDTPTSVDAVSFSSSGDDRFTAGSPDKVSGSHSVKNYGVTETLSWNLRRCGGALRLADVKLEDMRFPEWKAWKPISEQTGTIDGNIVRLTALVANDGGEEKLATVRFRETFKGDKWDGALADRTLKEVMVRVPAGEQREVTYAWDTSGYSWFDDGRPRLLQRVGFSVEEGDKKIDDDVRNLKIAPKPLVLVHGLWSNWRAWESWQNLLTTTHSYDWKAYPVGENPRHGLMRTGEEVGNLAPTNTISENADQLGRTIEHAQRERNAWHVDLVAHSMGGLISRRYIHAMMPRYADGKPQVSHLVMLGTPNMGSHCADLISLPLELSGKSMHALRELRPSVVADFNANNVDRKGVEFSILAGKVFPTGCYTLTFNDGVVTVPSAMWGVSDSVEQRVLHTSMTTSEVFGDFVRPRVAIGPTKATARKNGGATVDFKAVDLDPPPATNVKPDFARMVKVGAGATVEVPIDVAEARNFGLTFSAPSDLSAVLKNDSGTVVAKSEQGSPEAAQLFRSLAVNAPVAKAQWTLSLFNAGRREVEVPVSTWSNAQ